MNTSYNLDNEALTKILLLQNMIGQLPSERAVFEFVARGVSYLPGVAAVDFLLGNTGFENSPTPAALTYPVQMNNEIFGYVQLQLNDTALFEGYRAYIGNLCFMMAAVVQRFRRAEAERDRQLELERRVEQRTEELALQIVETQSAMNRLEEQKERLAVTLRSIEDGVITTDNKGRILSLNRAAEKFTGWRATDAIGLPLSRVYRLQLEDGNTGFTTAEAMTDSPELLSQGKLTDQDGHELIVSHLMSPIHDHNSQQVGLVVVFRDITRQMTMRDRLERIARLDSVGVLAGGIAHDFNNLLSGLFGYLEMAQNTSDIDEIRSLLNKTSSVYERAKNLTGQLLTFSRGGAPVLKTGNLEKVVRDAASFALSGANVSCEFDIAKDLWHVAFDEHQIAQVIDNIVINAKQAMAQSGRIQVTMRNTTMVARNHDTLPADEYVQISIQDFGQGIPDSIRSRIFDPFFTTRKEGSGLGLSTSHSIIQKHGGAIEVESRPSEGTTFHIFLRASNATPKSASVAPARFHVGSGTVLVLDDEAFLRDISSAMLKSMGYHAVCFSDGPEVLEYLHSLSDADRGKVVAGLFDLTIPGGSGGAEIVDALRQMLGDRFVAIAASGYSAGDVMSNPMEFGFTTSLPKPFRKKNLSDLLNKYLS
ncbi:MAG: PAS domain S-box protein [Deltaproteobacteria bacterium]|nr:PAS domain S-box protein [Deltaproteobacteria bacterium]